MIFRRVLIAGLVGGTMLAGCNNADDKAPAAPDAQGSFAEDISPQNGGVDQATIKGLKDTLDTLQANIVILQRDGATSKETLAALKSPIELLQSRAGQTEASVAALTELGPRIGKLDAGLKSLTDNFKTLEGRTAAIQADTDTLKPLLAQFAALKDDYGKAIKLKLEAAALAPLLADIDLLKTGKADAGKLADLQAKLDGLKDAVDKAKLSTDSVDGFKKTDRRVGRGDQETEGPEQCRADLCQQRYAQWRDATECPHYLRLIA